MKATNKEKHMKSIRSLKSLDDKIKQEKNKISLLQNKMIKYTIEEVCNTYNVTFEDIKKKDRHGGLVLPRQILMYKLRDIGLSLKRIARELNRDHTTIMHGIRVIEGQKDLYDDIKLD